MKALTWLLGLGVLVAAAGCGDDEPAGSATTGTGATGNTGGSGASSGGAAGGGAGGNGGSAAGGSGNAGGSGGGASTLTCPSADCEGDDMGCTCDYACELCEGTDCSALDFSVECQGGIGGLTCTCTIDGEVAGTCEDTIPTCSERGCCSQFLP